MFKITFKDGVQVTIRGVEDLTVEQLSSCDVEFNIIANKAMNGSETELLRLCNLINNRLGVEVL